MSRATLSITRLSDAIGAQVHDLTADQLASDSGVAVSVLEALEANGVLVFRDLQLEPEAQVAFCERLGAVDRSVSHHPVAGIYRVTLDTSKNANAEYLHATFHWHIDGCTPDGDECPQMATLLSAKAVSDLGGETEFASTYAAYDDLDDDQQQRLLGLRVAYSLEASQRKVHPEPTEEQLAQWRRRKVSEFPWSGPTRTVAGPWSSAPRPTTWWGWRPTTAERCSTASWPMPPVPSASTGTTGRWATR